jgi:hypothetical protein
VATLVAMAAIGWLAVTPACSPFAEADAETTDAGPAGETGGGNGGNGGDAAPTACPTKSVFSARFPGSDLDTSKWEARGDGNYRIVNDYFEATARIYDLNEPPEYTLINHRVTLASPAQVVCVVLRLRFASEVAKFNGGFVAAVQMDVRERTSDPSKLFLGAGVDKAGVFTNILPANQPPRANVRPMIPATADKFRELVFRITPAATTILVDGVQTDTGAVFLTAGIADVDIELGVSPNSMLGDTGPVVTQLESVDVFTN